jgi:SAM-dependent methyltransferase
MTNTIQLALNFSCQICTNSSGNSFYHVSEMMFGTGEMFEYVECAFCGTLQIAELPKDLKRYYPSSYAPHSAASGLRTYLMDRAAFYQWHGFSLTGWIKTIISGRQVGIDALKKIGVDERCSILEIGCGAGGLLNSLYKLGFNSLTGIDPFIEESLTQEQPFPIFKKNLKEIRGNFDVILLNHVFEHMPDPSSVIIEIEKHLAPNGTVVILVPVSECEAWKRYRNNWIQIDAPRHFFLHTRLGMGLLCKKAGLYIDDVFWNSSEFQFVGSEQCKKGIPLASSKSIYAGGLFNRMKLIFKKLKWLKKVNELNKSGTGDQACFVIKRNRSS